MWSDNETLSDCIDYKHLISAITGIIDNPRLLPCSVGIFGDWGSGKSSLMGMVEESYKGKEDVLVIKFNGWLFEGYEDAKTGLMGRIVDEIIGKRTLTEKAYKAAIKMLKRINLLKVAGSVIKYGAGMAAMGPAGTVALSSMDILSGAKEIDYATYLKGKEETKDPDESLRSNIQAFHQNFDELIRETNLKKIVVFIDDLDRCTPDTIIGTLEAIKLFLFSKGTAFVIGADERLIKYAVRRRFPEIPGDSTEVGRDYLEKLIQYPIRIPPLNTIELTSYVNLLFSQLHIDVGEFELAREKILDEKAKKGFDFVFDVSNADTYFNTINDELKQLFQLGAQVVPILSVGLNGNPRQCKRFLNTLLIRYNMAKSKNVELDKRILAKLMLLEYFKPETFDSFYKQQAENNGLLPKIGMLEKYASEDRSGGAEAGAAITAEEEAFLKDSWIKSWLSSEPTLKNIDLRGYYYFSRDKLSIKDLRLQRMSPNAQEFYRKLMNESDSISSNVLNETGKLTSGDTSSIFEAVCQRTREDVGQTGEKSAMSRLYKFCEKKPELVSQWIGFLEKFPENDLPLTAITWVENLTKKSAFWDAGKKLITKWSSSQQNASLAKISKQKLKDIN